VLGLRRRAAAGDAAAEAPEPDGAPDRKAQKRAEAESRQRTYAQRKPLATRLAKLEREMEALAAEKTALEAWLASADAYTDANRDDLRRSSRARATSPGSSRASRPSGWSSATRWKSS